MVAKNTLDEFVTERLAADQVAKSRDYIERDLVQHEATRAEWREFIKQYPNTGTLNAPTLSKLRTALGFSAQELGNVLGIGEDSVRAAEEGKDVSVLAPALVRFVHAAQAVLDESAT